MRAQETFGAMARTERIFYILEQVRLCLERKDYIRYAPSWDTKSSTPAMPLQPRLPA